ncbi:MAG: hypothetical protein JWQ89_3633 [Devosia sp.]|uniref:helix-turn-helix domain-containing protein n=1 Tax=Devosia sp. TaxID=1871048 RepID=UPI00262C2505|nr:helix-turn-helix domain-containing protein [Devosia sp.]MDB5541906.1 hypothetical protein [Devosia sp.]
MDNSAKQSGIFDNQISPLVTTKEAAEILRCTPGNIRNLVYLEKLRPAQRINNKRLLFRRGDVERLVQVFPEFDD